MMSINSFMTQQNQQPNIQTSLEKGFEKVLSPFQQLIRDQTTSSVLLIIATVIALLIANSPVHHSYEALMEMHLGIVFGDMSLKMSLRHWINEGLMTFFFFLLGMEIKREILVGELNNFRYFILVLAAAAGGMLVPASIYYYFNAGTDYVHGWGIPMATDTAFAVGILTLLRRHIPVSAFAFLTALAIIDDLGAIIVIALFYSESVSVYYLGLCVIPLAVMTLMNVLGIRKPGIYLAGAIMAWLAMLGSGIHATIAGILVAATIPARPKHEPGWFFGRIDNLLKRFRHIERSKPDASPMLAESEQHVLIEGVKDAADKVTTPLRRWEHALERPIALFVMPVFAFANAGIPVNMQVFDALWNETIATGIMLGLVLGKVLGISLFAWLCIILRLGRLPGSLDMRHIIGIGMLGGIGFTMSIFISNLGFDNMPQTLLHAKAAILTGSLIAGICGYLWLRNIHHEDRKTETG
ncbi:MAG: Na+/H+ antiporter NhaA [Gammaproteobacteria bacterium]|nr:Na+/H+ antiporter NhaA [Gammaproteobacteria bacterium]